MKYNEAIDMILEGGSIRRYQSITRFSFCYDTNKDGVLRIFGTPYDAIFFKNDLIADDWIVEKDGVVYEDYPIGKMRIIEQRVPIDIIKKYFFIKDRTGTQDEPAELEEGGEPWEGIKMPIIADEVNEDWLEKKMSCFLGRHIRTNPIDNLAMHYCEQEDCGVSKCPFCFTQEQPKEQAREKCSICGESEKLKSCKYTIAGIIYCEDCKRNNKEIDAQYPELREKVTVEDVMSLIYAYGNKNAQLWVAARANACATHDPAVKFWKDSRNLAAEKVKQKLEYLVSLQEE